MLIPLLVKRAKYCSQQDRAEASVEHQALQRAIPMRNDTIPPAAPELEASVAVRVESLCFEWLLACYRRCAVLPSGAADTLEYVLLTSSLVNIL